MKKPRKPSPAQRRVKIARSLTALIWSVRINPMLIDKRPLLDELTRLWDELPSLDDNRKLTGFVIRVHNACHRHGLWRLI